MSYYDDEIRKQRQAMPKPTLSKSDIERNKRILQDIVSGNKQRQQKGLGEEEDKTEILLKDSLKRFEKKTAMHMEEAEKKIEEVISYYGN